MRPADLHHRELLDVETTPGIVRFAGQRALILDAVALGLLRKELLDTVGLEAGGGILRRFGYAHGWRTAEVLRTAVPWDSEEDWRTAGGWLHRLQGLVRFEPEARPPAEDAAPFRHAVWHDFYEAEQHLLHFGPAAEPVCWTLCARGPGLTCATRLGISAVPRSVCRTDRGDILQA